jgi:hypothetical protein
MTNLILEKELIGSSDNVLDPDLSVEVPVHHVVVLDHSNDLQGLDQQLSEFWDWNRVQRRFHTQSEFEFAARHLTEKRRKNN